MQQKCRTQVKDAVLQLASRSFQAAERASIFEQQSLALKLPVGRTSCACKPELGRVAQIVDGPVTLVRAGDKPVTAAHGNPNARSPADVQRVHETSYEAEGEDRVLSLKRQMQLSATKQAVIHVKHL